jgi:hypothetical protein
VLLGSTPTRTRWAGGAGKEHLLAAPEELAARGAVVIETDRVGTSRTTARARSSATSLNCAAGPVAMSIDTSVR